MMYDILTIDIHGAVDQTGLDRLRTQLNLTKYGRLSDDWDQQFGYRRIEGVSGANIKIVLYRDFDAAWEIQVIATEQLNPSTDEIALLQSELVNGITAAGFQASVRKTPPFDAP